MAVEYKDQFAIDISGKVLSSRLAQFVHQFTCYWHYRPWGVSNIIASHDTTGFNLHMINPAGDCFVPNPDFQLIKISGLLLLLFRQRKANCQSIIRKERLPRADLLRGAVFGGQNAPTDP